MGYGMLVRFLILRGGVETLVPFARILGYGDVMAFILACKRAGTLVFNSALRGLVWLCGPNAGARYEVWIY